MHLAQVESQAAGAAERSKVRDSPCRCGGTRADHAHDVGVGGYAANQVLRQTRRAGRLVEDDGEFGPVGGLLSADAGM